MFFLCRNSIKFEEKFKLLISLASLDINNEIIIDFAVTFQWIIQQQFDIKSTNTIHKEQ